MIDAHLHVWDSHRTAYEWLKSAPEQLNRLTSFSEVEPALRAANVDGVVLVQAANTVSDTLDMFAVDSDLVSGVVAWADLMHPPSAALQIEAWAAEPRFAGLRHLIHDEPDPDWLARAQVRQSLRLLSESGRAFDVVGVLPRHLELAAELADELPDLRIVIDHLGTPDLSAGPRGVWLSRMSDLASRSNVWVKLSGLSTLNGAANADWSVLEPFVVMALELFGSERVAFGSDWPVSTTATTYEQTLALAQRWVAGLSASERADVMDRSARTVYRL